MDLNSIPISAAGSLSVAIVALFFVTFQGLLFIKKRKLNYNMWATVFSFSTSGYAFFVFLQYVMPATDIQHVIDKVQFSFLVVMAYSFIGFSKTYLEIPYKLYHKIDILLNFILLIILWSTDWIINNNLVSRHFHWLGRPYVESGTGPLGAPFMIYIILAAAYSLYLWISRKTKSPGKYRIVGVGISVFIIFGIHDTLASINIFPTIQFLLVYGFLFFSTALLYFTVQEYIQIENQAYALQRQNEELGIIARTDGLTKLANRYSFDTQYEKEWKILKRQRLQKTAKGSLSLILCDIDFFKEYNDSYGHLAGDTCLVSVAETLAACARRPADFVSRYGGDEFAILLPDTLQAGAVIVAEFILLKMRERNLENKSSPVQPYVTISLGIASIFSETDLAQEDLFLRADRALYKAKKNGRNRFEVCTEGLTID